MGLAMGGVVLFGLAKMAADAYALANQKRGGWYSSEPTEPWSV